MNWKEGTYFSIAVWGLRGYWVVLNDIDSKYALCGRIMGSDPRISPESDTFKMVKSLYDYGGRQERNNLLLYLLRALTTFKK